MNGVLYNTETFANIFINQELFINEYNSSPFKTDDLKEDNIKLIYWLLIGDYANSPIASSDLNQFKIKLFSIIYQYAPTYIKKMEVQKNIRELDENQIRLGTTAINNQAKNNDGLPSIQATEELSTINSQLVNKWKKSPLEAYSLLTSLLSDNITKIFLNKFKVLFKWIVEPEEPNLYVED